MVPPPYHSAVLVWKPLSTLPPSPHPILTITNLPSPIFRDENGLAVLITRRIVSHHITSTKAPPYHRTTVDTSIRSLDQHHQHHHALSLYQHQHTLIVSTPRVRSVSHCSIDPSISLVISLVHSVHSVVQRQPPIGFQLAPSNSRP
jgi:hypothetical protein